MRSTSMVSCRRIFQTVACLLCLLIGLAPHPVQAEDYTLDTGDALRISIFGEPSYPLDTTIDDRGAISLPLLGEIDARGLTPAALSDRIRKAFQEQKLLLEPFVQVNVREYRPFFISGAVATPGSYPYKPGITIRHALAIAGGFKPLAMGNELPALKMADLRAERANLLIDEFRLLARLERLRAESKDRDTFAPPREQPLELSPDLLRDIVLAEQQQLQARRAAFRSGIAYLDSSLARAKRDVEMLEVARKERDSAAKFQLQQLETSRQLSKKGLVTNNNLLTAERTQNSYRVDVAEANVNRARAEQEILTVESEIRKKQETRELELITEIEQEQLQVAKTQSALRYVTDKLLYVSTYGQHTFDDLRGSVRVVIFRGQTGKPESIEANEATAIRAGDVIDVSIRASEKFYDVNPGTVGN